MIDLYSNAAASQPPRSGPAAATRPRVNLPAARHLLPMEVCVLLLDKEPDQVLQIMESGQIDFAWNIASPGARRRDLRIWRESLLALVNRSASEPRSVEDVINSILPARDPRTPELQRWFCASQSHVQRLVEAGELRPCAPPVATRGPNAFTRIERASVAEFLRKRRLR